MPSSSSEANVRRFHAHVRQGYDYEQIANMIEHGVVDVDCRDKYRNTALLVGAQRGHSTACCLLLELGADVNARNMYDASALNHALSNQHIDVALLLLRRGANPNNRAKNGHVPLLSSIQFGLTDVCKELLRYGADVDVRLNDGASAVFLASQNGHLDLLKLLAASGADISMPRNDRINALWIACQLGHTSIVHEILECYKRRRLSMDQRDRRRSVVEDKKTSRPTTGYREILKRCAAKAAAKGFTDIVRLLIEHAEYFDRQILVQNENANDQSVEPKRVSV